MLIENHRKVTKKKIKYIIKNFILLSTYNKAIQSLTYTADLSVQSGKTFNKITKVNSADHSYHFYYIFLNERVVSNVVGLRVNYLVSFQTKVQILYKPKLI